MLDNGKAIRKKPQSVECPLERRVEAALMGIRLASVAIVMKHGFTRNGEALPLTRLKRRVSFCAVQRSYVAHR